MPIGHEASALVSMKPDELRKLAARIRLNAAEMVGIQGFGYLGQALSSAEVFSVLFGGGFYRAGHDRFVLSPGHYVVVLYAVAAELRLLERQELANYGSDGALLEAIGTERTPLLDLTCGSLGQGLSGGIGFALASRYSGDGRRTFVFLSDGEMEEGQIWEAAMFAAHHGLDQITVLIDANNSQVDGPITSVTTIEPLGEKWRAFGWQTFDVCGHDIAALTGAFGEAPEAGRPRVIIARTNILGNLKSLPSTADGHWLKLDPAVKDAVIAEIKAQGA
jgi:transketolase